jgi:hypothetical protein
MKPRGPIRHKFSAKPTKRDGQHFPSQKEARFYDQLVLLKEHGGQGKHGPLVFFLRQVPFHLPGGVKYVVDFQLFWYDGTIEFVDVKGHRTKEFIRNKKLVEALYPIKIREV